MNGKLIVIEGLDGSGKTTQFELLSENIKNARFITFPNYTSLSGKIISEYLKGTYTDVNEESGAYSASCFYAVDRYISFKTDWGKDYSSGIDFISARYTSSNLIYQMAKLPKKEWDDYIKWMYDFEYGKLAIPKPDAVIYLDMPLSVSQELLIKRYGGNENKKDIHESDLEFLGKCIKAALYAANKDNWFIFSCAENGKPKTIESINKGLLKIIKDILNDRV